MKKVDCLYRFKTFGLCGLVAAGGILVAGCGQAPQEVSTPTEEVIATPPSVTVTPVNAPAAEPAPSVAPTVATPTPDKPANMEAPPKPAVNQSPEAPPAVKLAPNSEEAMAKKTEVNREWFIWYASWEKYQKSGKTDEKTAAALEAKAKKLSKLSPAKPINESLELVAFNWRMSDKNPEKEQKALFNAMWLFRKTGDINLKKDHTLTLLLRGTTDKSFEHLLATEKEPNRTRFEISDRLELPLNAMKTGEYFVVNKKVTMPSIPYQMQTFLVEQSKQKDGRWKFVAPFGERLTLGWRADLGE